MKRFNAILAGAAMLAGAQFVTGTASAATIVCNASTSCSFVDDTGFAGSSVNRGSVATPRTATSSFQITLPTAGTFEISLTAGGTGLTFTRLVFGATTITNPLAGQLYTFAVNSAGVYNFSYTASNTANQRLAFSSSYSFAAVPEPAAWGLMIGGFAMAGASMRRRRNVRVAIA
ncbi:PEPxxWA-CTERM sorting domain-containing protein [Sphingomonas elodea]|uniref:PEPxxWA-CTERM sorting domain-containing protein n=1 Tax=Sphingomonas elodea TaxID=179878 RepID=UPI0002631A96|nr:PEPxxWA-CTERM sorting domain-containing protein [Sphingomonas elodea]